jgi:oligopeptide/dipeptide ABC transporter ATP-binding protein
MASMASALIEARRVTKRYGGGLFQSKPTVALEDFSLAIDTSPASITAVVGESGSGKTTLGRLLLGLSSPSEGEVRYRGKDLRGLSRSERRQFYRDVQVIFQDPYEVFNPFYKVDHVLEVPALKFGLASSRSAARKLIEEALQVVGLRPDETLGRHPHQLSGGQRQRIMIARAMMMRPKLIVADEPVSMVDASLRATILDTLRHLNQGFGISLLYITHDLTTAYQLSQNVIVLYRGSVAEAGDVEKVVKQPAHPYTQMLIDSIPLPDPSHPWQPLRARTEGTAVPGSGCKFAHKCPVADVTDPRCRQIEPPFFMADRRRVVACYQHRSSPVVPHEELTKVLALTSAAADSSQGVKPSAAAG